MGVIYYLNKSKNLKLSNKKLKANFFNTFSFWGSKSNILNINTKTHILGKRKNFGVINSEHHLEMLKRAIKFSGELTKEHSKMLFVNDQINTKFDGIIKTLAFRSREQHFIGKWSTGKLTKTIKKLPYKTIILCNPDKNVFLQNEANLTGIPIIGLCNIDSNLSNIIYPILTNNDHGNSLMHNFVIISNSVLEQKLITFIKNKKINNS